jgi:hypothetical protein
MKRRIHLLGLSVVLYNYVYGSKFFHKPKFYPTIAGGNGNSSINLSYIDLGTEPTHVDDDDDDDD